MLKFFNRLEKTRNFVLLVFGILMVLSLVLFYAPARNNFTENLREARKRPPKSPVKRSRVGELSRQKEQYSQYQGRQFPGKDAAQRSDRQPHRPGRGRPAWV